MSEVFYVSCKSLNMRSSPKVKRGNIIRVLHQNDKVTKIYDGKYPWIFVYTGAQCRGYVSSKYLYEKQQPVEEHNQISAVHMRHNTKVISRFNSWGRAYRLDESEIIQFDKRLIQSYDRVAVWLDVEKAPRYKPSIRGTCCNIYAYDFCCQMKAYIPRVWWYDTAIALLKQGVKVKAEYAKTIQEVSANRLYDWLTEWGELFGWRRVFNPAFFQITVNTPMPGIICAKNKNPKKPGHITVGLPETAQHKAVRKDGYVTKPLQSEAGGRNRKIFTGEWFKWRRFKECGFWVYEGVKE